MKFAHFEFDLKHDLIGSGQSSHVYRARDLSLDRTVVLKILEAHVTIDPEARRRFSREAKTAGSLAHPNLAAVHEFGTIEVQGQERSYIAMEFVAGKPLDKVIKELSDQILGYEECLKIGEQVADALATVLKVPVSYPILGSGLAILIGAALTAVFRLMMPTVT